MAEREERHAAASEVAPGADTARAPFAGGDTDGDWRRLHGVVRQLLRCEEILRLYPEGHRRVTETLGECRAEISDYAEAMGRSFSFTPELVLDVTAAETSPLARDLSAFAYLCRGHLIRRLTLHPEADDGSIAALVRFLGDEDATPPLVRPTAVELALFRPGEDAESYRFSTHGDQLVPAPSPEAGAGIEIPDDYPPALRRALQSVFSSPEVSRGLSRLEERAAKSSPRGGTVDLVEEVVRGAFSEPERCVGLADEEIIAKLDRFLRLLTGLVTDRLPPAGQGVTPSSPASRDLLSRALGVPGGGEAALAGRETAGPRAERPHPGGERTAAPSGTGTEIEPVPTRVTSPDARGPRLDEGLDELYAVAVDRDECARRIDEMDHALEVLRIRADILAVEVDEGTYRVRREGLLDALANHRWPDADAFLEELDGCVDLLGDREPDGGIDLSGEALARQREQSVVDEFFRRRVAEGQALDDLRPVLQRLAREDRGRPIRALTSLWKSSPSTRRAAILDEIYDMSPSADVLAAWARRSPRAFASQPSVARLRAMPGKAVEAVLTSAIAGDGVGDGAAVSVLLRVVAERGSRESEPILARMIERGRGNVRREALVALKSCSRPETSRALERIVDAHNERETPDLDEVRLALTALLRSRLPRAREYLHAVRTRRQVLRHVYRKDIREILALLGKAEGVVS